MQDIMSRFNSTLEDPYGAVRRLKETQTRKVIGCAPMHFAEEIVSAAGALPVVLQESAEPVTTGYTYVYPFYCGFVRSLVDIAVKGKLSFLDGLLIPDTCLQMRGAFGILQTINSFPYLEFVQLPPYLKDAGAIREVKESFKRCQAGLEEYTGRKIADDSLRAAMVLYNKNRTLLRRLYELRRAKPGLLRAKELTAIVMSSMVMPKAEHNELLEQLLPYLEKKSTTKKTDTRVKVVISGHLCQSPKPDLLDIIEDLGAVIVDDDIYTGYRYFATDARLTKNLWEGLARRYLNPALPCPTRSMPARGKDDWGQYLVRMCRRAQAQGVIILMVKFCEPHMLYYPTLKEALTAAGVPHLLVETEHEVVSLGGVKTRVQAFVEMLRERRAK